MTKKGVWDLQDVRDEYLQGNWTYSSTAGPFLLYVAGQSSAGKLGLNDQVNRSSPTQIPGTQWTATTSDVYGNMMATKSDGTLWTWGNNDGGQLAQNDRVYRSSPIQIPGTQWSNNIACSSNNSAYAIKTDGTLWVWGRNNNGNLGTNGAIGVSRSSPVQVPGTQWNLIKAGASCAVATKTDGTLWSWGGDGNGRLGLNNDNVQRSSPVQIPGTQWDKIHDGGPIRSATKTDGTLWAWGNNDEGDLGLNDRAPRSSPTQIPGTQWNSANGGWSSLASTKTDGTLWAWGQNPAGQLAQNDIVYRSSPTQIPGTWSFMSAANSQIYGLKTDGTFWVWGYNGSGPLGVNDRSNRSSPIQLPGTQWNSANGFNNSSSVAFLKSS